MAIPFTYTRRVTVGLVANMIGDQTSGELVVKDADDLGECEFAGWFEGRNTLLKVVKRADNAYALVTVPPARYDGIMKGTLTY